MERVSANLCSRRGIAFFLRRLLVATVLLSSVMIIGPTSAQEDSGEATPRLVFTRGNRVKGTFVNDSLLVATVSDGKAACRELYRGWQSDFVTLWHEAADARHLVLYHRHYNSTTWPGKFDVVEGLLTVLSTTPGTLAGLHHGSVYFFGARPSGMNIFSCSVSDGRISDVMRVPLSSGVSVSMRISPNGKRVAWLSRAPGPTRETGGTLSLSVTPLIRNLDYKDVAEATVLAPRIASTAPFSPSYVGLPKIPEAAFCWLDNDNVAFLEAQGTPEKHARTPGPWPSAILVRKVDLEGNVESVGDVRFGPPYKTVLSRDHSTGRLTLTATRMGESIGPGAQDWPREIVYEVDAEGEKLRRVNLNDRQIGAFRIIGADRGRARILTTRPKSEAVPVLEGKLRQYRVSGDGQWIAVIRRSSERVEGMPLSELVIVNAQGRAYSVEKGWLRNIWCWMPAK